MDGTTIIAILLLLCGLACFIVDVIKSGFSLISLGLAFVTAFLLVWTVSSIN